jgi:hypothetical protein
MLNRIAAVLTLIPMLLAAAGTSGCAGREFTTERNPFAGLWYPTQGDDPYSLQVVGPVEIDVESFGGDVFITVDERERAATVRMVRRAVHGAGRFQEARAALEDINLSARVVPGDLGPKLEVRTSTTHPEQHFLLAHLHIVVPEAEGVRVRTSNGRVHARGIQGPIDIVTSDGEVRVITSRPMNYPVSIVAERSTIEYRVRGESSGLIDAETIGGRISHHIRHGRLTIDRGTKSDRLFARFNHGDNPITLRTTWGNIHIAAVGDPDRVGSLIRY